MATTVRVYQRIACAPFRTSYEKCPILLSFKSSLFDCYEDVRDELTTIGVTFESFLVGGALLPQFLENRPLQGLKEDQHAEVTLTSRGVEQEILLLEKTTAQTHNGTQNTNMLTQNPGHIQEGSNVANLHSIADASTAGNPVRQPLQVVFSPVMNNISSPHISPSVVSNQTASPNSGAWGGSTSSVPRFSEPVSRLIGRSRCSPGDRNLRQASLFETKAFYDRERMNSAPTEDYLKAPTTVKYRKPSMPTEYLHNAIMEVNINYSLKRMRTTSTK